MRRAMVGAGVGVTIVLAGAACAPSGGDRGGAATAPPPTMTGSAQVQRTGVLRGGMAGIGGESTGWQLEMEDGTRLDVDVSEASLDAQRFRDKSATVLGTMTMKKWVERGETPVLKADVITAGAAAGGGR